mmetsp:Transcript_5708/g.6186  ORF Transcript_5708/g.6186 Transcript_5708/m.6186 type:complete len:235 (+) Transcript_5708:153-857(+)
MAPHDVEYLWAAMGLLGVTIIFDSISMMRALFTLNANAKETNLSLYSYIMRGDDTTSVSVLVEDATSLVGQVVAATCLTLAAVTGHPIFDPIGSIIIGVLLGCSACFLVKRNMSALVPRSVPDGEKKVITQVLKDSPLVDKVYKLKAVQIGPNVSRVSADLEYNGIFVAERVLAKIKLDEVVPAIKTHDDLRQFLLYFGESLLEELGDEVDKLEVDIKADLPDRGVIHIDFESN